MKERIDILSSKYFIEELEKEEFNELTELIKNPEFKERFEWFRNNWEDDQADPGYTFDMKRGKNMTASMIGKVDPGFVFPRTEQKSPVSRSPLELSFRRWMGIAAAIAIIAASAITLNTLKSPRGETEMPLSYSVVSTQVGQHSDVSLPDGSSVFMNSSSKFIRPVEFSGNERVVQLIGEAYFEIAPEPDRPFIIHSDQVLTQVLGTKFNVKSYPGEDIVSISVVEGSVRVSKKNPNSGGWIKIVAGEEYVFNRSTMSEEVRVFSEHKVLGWREGRFVFDSSPLQRVLPIISRKYDVDFELDNENLNQCLLTAEFDNEDLETILDVISFANDIDYEYCGRKIILKGSGCLK